MYNQPYVIHLKVTMLKKMNNCPKLFIFSISLIKVLIIMIISFKRINNLNNLENDTNIHICIYLFILLKCTINLMQFI